MTTKVVMEALSPTMEEGRLVKWLKADGDKVAKGDVLAEIETDKAVMELVARGDGVLRARLLAEGDTAPVGALVGVIAAPDEDISALTGAAAAPTATATAAPGAATPAPVAAPAAPIAPAPEAAPSAPDRGNGGRQRSSPLARRLASERGLDLQTLHGTGPGGRVIRRDIEAAIGAPIAPARPAVSPTVPAAVAPVPAAPGAAPQPRAPGADYTDIPLTQIRKTIARRLAESIGPIPTFYLTMEADLTRTAELRDELGDSGADVKISFNDIILKAVAVALSHHPEVNSHWLGDRIRQHARVHLGMAVAVEDGLITPVIFDADRKPLSDIAREAKSLAARARERKLTPAEYTGSTFSVSNLGMFGIDQFTAIINPPEVGIIAVGAIEEKPVVLGGAVTVRKRVRLTMSCDHRVVDGATGAKFLQELRGLLENPLMMVY